jgi:hypothetical protein
VGASTQARSGGAVPTIRSVAKVIGADPRENTIDPATRTARPAAGSSWVSSPKPPAARTMPAAITKAGRARRTSSGVSRDPRMNPMEEGSIHRPAAGHRDLCAPPARRRSGWCSGWHHRGKGADS